MPTAINRIKHKFYFYYISLYELAPLVPSPLIIFPDQDIDPTCTIWVLHRLSEFHTHKSLNMMVQWLLFSSLPHIHLNACDILHSSEVFSLAVLYRYFHSSSWELINFLPPHPRHSLHNTSPAALFFLHTLSSFANVQNN